MRSAFVDIFRTRGIRGLYAGVTPTLVEIVPYAGLQFGTYDTFKRWMMERKLLLEIHGAHIARIFVFETNRLSKNNLIGYCEIDLLEFLTQDSSSDTEVFDLLDPSSSSVIVGHISITCSIEDPVETEKSFVRCILSIVAWNHIRSSNACQGDESLSSFQLSVSGLAAGTCAKVVCHPLDLVKKRFQAQQVKMDTEVLKTSLFKTSAS